MRHDVAELIVHEECFLLKFGINDSAAEYYVWVFMNIIHMVTDY